MNTTKIEKYTVFTDGGSRGNPGPAAIGCVIKNEISIVHEISVKIGITTNNVAEYSAVVAALTWLNKISSCPKDISFYCDSQLIVQQLKGSYKVKDAKMKDLFFHVKKLEKETKNTVSYHFVPREQNTRADLLVNNALDS